MSQLLWTIIFSIALMALVIAGLGIGLILTGKSRLKKGCGLSPKEKKKGDSSCPLCGEKETCPENDQQGEDDHSNGRKA